MLDDPDTIVTVEAEHPSAGLTRARFSDDGLRYEYEDGRLRILFEREVIDEFLRALVGFPLMPVYPQNLHWIWRNLGEENAFRQ